MTTPLATELAWLAGLWDGEGSVGINGSGRFSKANNSPVIAAQIQLQMTHVLTVMRAVEILKMLSAGRVISYHWAKKKAHQKDACGFTIGKTVQVRDIARALTPFAVTKAEQWALVREFCELRIARQGLSKNGDLIRGGGPGWWKPYGERELEIYEQVRELNKRGKPTGVAGGMDPQRQASM